ncbi:MAG: NAD(P)H-hydrate dehydratase, partial [candidate division Zixibacteria bacterium]|nr:NAD(P)H-hydrate dehydratase [candidate division Zixibacteria bacterium]
MDIPSLTLMENAGRGVAEIIRDELCDGDVSGRPIAIVCGRGNNGGDGFVVGRYFRNWSAAVSIFLIGTPDRLKGDGEVNYKRATAEGIVVTPVDSADTVPEFDRFELLVDAMFGTGFRGPIKGTAEHVVEAMNRSGVRIVAVDNASGVDSDSGEADGAVVSAYLTVSLACSKRGQWLYPGRSHVGQLRVVDIGIPAEAVAEENIRLAQIINEFVGQSLPARPPEGHKGTFGKALILGGSVGMSGAVALAANACMRCGVGLTYAGVPASIADLIDIKATEPVVLAFPEVNKKRVLARRGLGEITQRIETVDAVAIGPGLSRHHETQELTQRLVSRRTKPTVLDADGLNAFEKDRSALETDSNVPLIITPHVGEMARLLERSTADIAADREQAAIDAAHRFKCIAVMKGAPTFVAAADGSVYLNPTGNNGLGSGGVGDVLTGIIVSFLAQGVEPLTATLMGVYIHGLAGDFAAADYGTRSLVASDLVSALPDVLLHLEG